VLFYNTEDYRYANKCIQLLFLVKVLLIIINCSQMYTKVHANNGANINISSWIIAFCIDHKTAVYLEITFNSTLIIPF